MTYPGWVPILQLDDALLEQQSKVYAVQGVDESEPAMQPRKKRKQVYTNGEEVSKLHRIPSSEVTRDVLMLMALHIGEWKPYQED